MANEKVSQLPTVANATAADILYAIQGGVSVQETVQQILNLGLSITVLNFAGNPNGNLAGKIYQLCWDTTHNLLWVCTTTGSAIGAIWQTTEGTLGNGQILIGSSGSAPVLATITAGSGITVTNGPGSISISGTASSIGWNVVTTNTAMLADDGYIANSASPITLTLPTTAAVGTALVVTNFNTGGFTIAQNVLQNIRIGTSVSTTGAGGSVASTAQGDSVYLICAVANTSWIAINGVQGALIIV